MMDFQLHITSPITGLFLGHILIQPPHMMIYFTCNIRNRTCVVAFLLVIRVLLVSVFLSPRGKFHRVKHEIRCFMKPINPLEVTVNFTASCEHGLQDNLLYPPFLRFICFNLCFVHSRLTSE